jgi:small subunit ribosomal protein S24e
MLKGVETMELEIQDKRENTLLKRTEVQFVLHHPNSPTPKRDNVREELSKALKVPKDRVVVDHMESSFGVHDTKGYAKIYPSKEEAIKIEREYLLLRNKLVEKKAKKTDTPTEA